LLETAKIEHLDSALLGELQRNGRASLINLARRLGVSHGTVRYHLERLLNEGLVKVVAVVDPARLGFRTQVIIGIDAELRLMEEIEATLVSFEEVTFVATLTGRLDFLLGAVFHSNEELRRFLSEKLSRVKGVRKTETFHILKLGKHAWDWVIPNGLEGGRARAQ
jgi:Lrp/AsnC family transcriptional regulator for asnA, asnC and gidA